MTRKINHKNPLKSAHARPDAEKDLGNNVTLKARFWLEKDGKTFLASGRVELLKLIVKEGSILSAAEKMGISYHHAWNLLDKMNLLTPEDLVVKISGGKGGGGSTLTPEGQKLIEKFISLQQEFQELIEQITFSFNNSDDL
jgi:molybdate transport system regulatory protein